MTIPRKGSRKVIVDGEAYRWLVRRKATYSQVDYGNGKIHVAVEHVEKHGTTLLVQTNHPHPQDWATEHVVPVTPADIATWIQIAITNGWCPKEPGATFHQAV